MTVNTRVIKIFLSRHTADYVPLADGLRLQVLPSVAYLPRCQKHHFGAFIQDQLMLVVWDDQPKNLLNRGAQIEESLMQMIWRNADTYESVDEKAKDSTNVSTVDLGSGVSAGDLEEALANEQRPTLLINSILVGLTLTLLIAALGSGWSSLAQEVAVDENYVRLALLIVTPCHFRVAVLYANCRCQPCTDLWSNQPNERELQILLRQSISETPSQPNFPSACHHSDAGLQGRSGYCHSAHNHLTESSNFHLPTSRRYCQHLH